MGYITLNKKAFFQNLDYFSSLSSKDKLSIALKDNAYGHGIEEVATMCQEYGIKHIFVRDLREASIVKKFSFETVLVLYDIPKELNQTIIISINNLEDIAKIPDNSKVELKFDTGMNRNGITKNNLNLAIQLINKNNLILNGIFTHFCCADENNDITKLQEKEFQNIIKEVKNIIKYPFRIHCANSHGAFKVDNTKYDLVRIGIGAYGYLEFQQSKYLQPILSLYANKISTKVLKQGEHVGYGSKAYIATSNITISNYDIGYADGFLRLSESKQSTIQNGKEILGRISMDSLSVEGDDEVICIFNNVSKFSKLHNTINYEILSLLNPFIPRFIIN